MKNTEITKEMKAFIEAMDNMIEFYGHNPQDPKMELIKNMYIDSRINGDEFFTLIK